jgi:hypothetical protein
MLHYVYRMMTSWAIVCDVWYLPPMYRNANESAVDFANRVKAEIAQKGGLVDLDWDGGLKRSPAKKEWKEKQQLDIATKIINNNSLSRKSSACTLVSGSEYSEDEQSISSSSLSPPPLSPTEAKILEHPEEHMEREEEDDFIMMPSRASCESVSTSNPIEVKKDL